MNKTKIFAATFFAVAALAATVCAQQPSDKTNAADFSIESLKINSEFSSQAEARKEKANPAKNPFAAEIEAGNFANRRQQTYVRPSKEARLKRYASDAFGVPALIGATFGATFAQIGNDPPEWKKTAGGFGRRFASSYATNAIRNTISFGVSEAFRLDNRFERSGEKRFGKRLKHAFLGSYTTRTRTGKRIPDFPHFIGTYSAAIIANETWYPRRYGYKDGLRDGTISLGVRFGVNLLREFVFSK